MNMEIRKELPEIFESFAEQRRNSFLAVKECKDNNIPVVGSYCTYFPREIASAMGAATVSLCATSAETIQDAERDLPKNLCPLIKSSYGFAITDKCPYFYFSDLVVGETTCDGKKKMYEYMSDFKDVFILELPNSQTENALALWKNELIRFKCYLENKFSTEISDEKLRKAIHTENAIRSSLKSLYELMKLQPAPITGYELFKVLYGSSFKLQREQLPQELNDVIDNIKEQYANGQMQPEKPRILLTGCPIGGATEKVIRAIEENGALVVAFENCTGAKSVVNNIDENSDDIIEAIARRYLNIGCSVMTPNKNRYELLGQMIDEYQIDGVVEMTLQACHTYNVESLKIKRFVNEIKNKPFISVETDYSDKDTGQLSTRLAAFIEML